MSGSRRTRRLAATGLAAVLALGALGTACGSSDDDVEGTTTTTAAPVTTTTTTPSTTAPPSGPGTTMPGTTVPGTPTTTTVSGLVPGQSCTPDQSPDCIDPEGTGDFVYLIGGADCMAGPLGGPLCTDLDGDGQAGYPDRG